MIQIIVKIQRVTLLKLKAGKRKTQLIIPYEVNVHPHGIKFNNWLKITHQ